MERTAFPDRSASAAGASGETLREVLDYLSGEDVEKKIEALVAKDSVEFERRKEEFYGVMDLSLSKEEKEDAVKRLMNEKLSDPSRAEKEQRLAALQIRKDYAEFKKK